ncbi:MAG: LysM peptidoglycan-binding domain-containing protein [Microbacteriaceae bacterium]|nr:LysM peptidoglycan-binding domain-containing protein [Microbacteriaceae bacterium]
MPIMLAGSIALSFTAPMMVPPERPQNKERESPSELGQAIRSSLAAAHAASTTTATTGATVQSAAVTPTSYTVIAGDSVSSISGKFGLATASVLALNGLGWKSVIHPGQILKLTNSRHSMPDAAPTVAEKNLPGITGRYTIVAGDTISKIAARFDITEQSILAANGYSRSSIIYAGSTLAIPGRITPTALNETVLNATPAVAVHPIPSRATTSHVIKKGETIAAIADRYRMSVQDILTANGLGWSSIIYAGRELSIPAIAAPRVDANGVTILTKEMAANAREILAVADSLGVNRRGKIIALATAMQESSLRNLPYGDRDSLGLFQQRPSTGWGSPTQVTTPAYAARLFFGGPRNPNAGITRGLLDILNWQNLTLTQAAQAVQRSAFPDAYAKWETSATAWVKALT